MFIEKRPSHSISRRTIRSFVLVFLAAVRNAVIRRELPLALEAIRYWDRKFFAAHSELDNASIWIHFGSTNPEYNRFEYWGTPYDYK